MKKIAVICLYEIRICRHLSLVCSAVTFVNSFAVRPHLFHFNIAAKSIDVDSNCLNVYTSLFTKMVANRKKMQTYKQTSSKKHTNHTLCTSRERYSIDKMY